MSALASKLLLGSLLVAGVAARRQWTGKGSAASISRCTDAPNWRSASGYTCIQYEENKYCTPNGTVGSGWQAAWGTLDQDKGKSLNATDACCACGGGKPLAWRCHHTTDCGMHVKKYRNGTTYAFANGTKRYFSNGRCVVTNSSQRAAGGSCVCNYGYTQSASAKALGEFKCDYYDTSLMTGAPTAAPCSSFDAKLEAANNMCSTQCNVSLTTGTQSCRSILDKMPYYKRNTIPLACAKAFVGLHGPCKNNLLSMLDNKQSRASMSSLDSFDKRAQRKIANASGVLNITDCKGDLGKDLAAINKACCVHSGMCDTQHPVPLSCTESCGTVFSTWFAQCGKKALAGKSAIRKTMSSFNEVCRDEGTTCTSARSCKELAAVKVLTGGSTAGPPRARWPSSIGNDTICGESGVTTKLSNGSYTSKCYGGDGIKIKGQSKAKYYCGSMGARLCSLDELLEGEASGASCGHDSKWAWTSSEGGCPRHQYMAVASGLVGGQQQVVGAACRNRTESLAVRCCADKFVAPNGVEVCSYSKGDPHKTAAADSSSDDGSTDGVGSVDAATASGSGKGGPTGN